MKVTMRIKSTGAAALAVAVLAAAPAPAVAAFDIKDAAETVGAMMIADRLGIDPNVVLMAKLASSSSVYDMAPAFAMAPYSTMPPDQLWAYRNAGYGWNQVATLGGVPAPTYQVLSRTRQLEPDVVWTDEFSSRYRVAPSSLEALRAAGYGWGEIGRAMTLSQETGMSVDEILYRHRVYGDWAVAAGLAPAMVYEQPIYVPPRTRTVALLPQPRVNYVNWDGLFSPTPTLWANSLMPESAMMVRNQPVIVRWSTTPIVQQPEVIRVVSRPRVINLDRFVWRQQPIRVASLDRIRVVRPLNLTQRVIVQSQPRYVVERRPRTVVVERTGARAQRLVLQQPQVKRRVVERERQRERIHRREDGRVIVRRDLPGHSEHGMRHARVNQNPNLTGRERGMRHKAIGGIGSASHERRSHPVKRHERVAAPKHRVSGEHRARPQRLQPTASHQIRVRSGAGPRLHSGGGAKVRGSAGAQAPRPVRRGGGGNGGHGGRHGKP